MFEPNREFITTAETILFVSTLFMWIYIAQTFVFIDSFQSLFLTPSWWLMLPVMTFVLFLRSFIGRRINLDWADDEEEQELDQKQR
jgi:type VI protein secretion system component VasK